MGGTGICNQHLDDLVSEVGYQIPQRRSRRKRRCWKEKLWEMMTNQCISGCPIIFYKLTYKRILYYLVSICFKRYVLENLAKGRLRNSTGKLLYLSLADGSKVSWRIIRFRIVGGFHTWGVPPVIIHFRLGVSLTDHPATGVPPIGGKPYWCLQSRLHDHRAMVLE